MGLLIEVDKLGKSKSGEEKTLYNKDSKIEFIGNYGSMDSQMTIFWQFLKASKYEKKIDKDIFEMNEAEIKEMLISVECSTITSAINHINTYKRYIDFKGVENPFYNFDSYSQLASEVIAKKKNKRYSRKDLLEMIDELNNYTDQALLLAIFEGIKGKSFSELLTLRASEEFLYHKEIDGEDKFFAEIYNEGTKSFRTIEISQDLFKLIRLADKQTSYRTNNENEIIETPFNDSEFVFKKAKKGKQDDSGLDRHFITRKFIFFKEFFGNEFLTADDIAQSGMMYMAYKQFLESKKIGKKELLAIGEQYNTVMATSNGKDYYRNITDIKRKVFNDELGKIYSELENIKYSD